MSLIIQKACKFQQYARVCLWGIPKSGKTHAALAIATTLAGKDGKVGVISSEYGSSALLSRKFPHNILDLTVDETGNLVPDPFHPKRYEEAIRLFVAAGYQVIIIDSLSHAWEGPGGVLEFVDKAAGNKSTFTNGWSEGTPLYHELIQTIVSPVSAPCHMIVTLRAKDGYVLEKNDRGKDAPRNVGLQPVFRKSFGFEMQLTIRMDSDLVGHVEASAYQEELPNGMAIKKPGEDLAYTLMRFLEGAPPPERIPTLPESYKRGLATGAWTKETFFSTASQALGITLDRSTRLSANQFKQLAAVAEAGAPVNQDEQPVTLSEPTASPATPDAPVVTAQAALEGPSPVTAQAPTPKPITSVVPSLKQLIKVADDRYPGQYGALHTAMVKAGLPEDAQKWTETQRMQAYETIKANKPAQVEPKAVQPTGEAATEAQLASIRKLYERLGKPEPGSTCSLDYLAAKELIAQLASEYKQSRAKAS